MTLKACIKSENPGYLTLPRVNSTEKKLLDSHLPESSTKNGLQIFKLTETISLRIRKTVSIRKTLELQDVRNGDIREIFLEKILSCNFHILCRVMNQYS